MNTENPITLHYTDDITLHIAGPAEEIISYLGLDIDTRGDEPASRLKLEVMTENGEWQAIEPSPTFFDELDRLREALLDDSQSRGADSTDSEFWLPEGFELMWELAVSQLHEDNETPRGVAVRSTQGELLSDDEAFNRLDALRVEFKSNTRKCRRVPLQKELIPPRRIHYLAFDMQKSPFVDIWTSPTNQLQVIVGVLNPTKIIWSGLLSNPLIPWEVVSEGYRRCYLPEQDDFRYGIILFNKRFDRKCKYKLRGGCDQSGEMTPL